MNTKSLIIIFIFYALMASAIVIFMYFLGHVLLQMPTWFVFILTSLSLLAFTIGLIVISKLTIRPWELLGYLWPAFIRISDVGEE